MDAERTSVRIPKLINRRAPAARLQAMLDKVGDDESDMYGEGGAVTRLEKRMAALLGKDAALLMPTGTMASQVALRIHADARNRRMIGFHPQAHIEVHERKGYSLVHGLTGLLVGSHDEMITMEDLQAIKEPLAAVLLELPQRDLGGVLPEWDDLVAQTELITVRGAANHLDGARLWEAQPYYDRPHAEIAALFDTVYVSLYKSLEGVAGAIVAGSTAFVDEAREWRGRLGGQLFNAWPLALSAEIGLDEIVPRMPAYWTRAKEITAALTMIDGVDVVPNLPQTPLFHIHVAAPKPALDRVRKEVEWADDVPWFKSARTTSHPGHSRYEITVGETIMGVSVDDFVAVFDDLVGRARRTT